jgi:hypothetical protein
VRNRSLLLGLALLLAGCYSPRPRTSLEGQEITCVAYPVQHLLHEYDDSTSGVGFLTPTRRRVCGSAYGLARWMPGILGLDPSGVTHTTRPPMTITVCGSADQHRRVEHFLVFLDYNAGNHCESEGFCAACFARR